MLNTDWLVPMILAAVIGYGLIQRTGVYDAFVRGAGKGLKTAISVLPCLVAVMVAVEMMKASGTLALLCNLLARPMALFGLPGEVAPLVVVRPFSGMAALGILDDIYRTTGPDSHAARTASVIMGSTETVFYTVAIYYGSVGIKKSRHTIPAALVSLLASIVISGLLCQIM